MPDRGLSMNLQRHVKALLLATAAFAVSSAEAQVELTQTLTLKKGWNAVYIEVSPTQPLDYVFAGWPVSKVGFYDPASFLATRQFGGGFDSKGLSMNPVATWFRDYPEASVVERVPAGTVALVFNTNDAPTVVQISGVPAAPRMTWHVTDTNEVMNFVGFSLQAGAKVYPDDYLDGFDGEFGKGGFMRFGGLEESEGPSILPVYSSKFSDGEVLLAASTEQSDWSGALFVSPMGGPEFGEDATRASLSIRNDGYAARTVAVSLLYPNDVGYGGGWGDIDLPASALKLRDADVAHTNAVWGTVAPAADGRIASKRLEAGETWKLEFGLDRAALPVAPKGATFGALLRVTDVDGDSKMRADVPITGASSGRDADRTAWPAGLWVAEVAFNRILTPGSPAETETGGEAKVRLPIHIAGDGIIRLLQRVVAAGSVDPDGTLAYHLYGGSAAVPNTATVAMRISAVTLPTETPVIAAEPGGALSAGSIAFSFTVADDGATSILRHPLHPQHDGLKWDFSTPAPSGDDFANYKEDVKPETFSVACRVLLVVALDGGEAPWNPDNTKAGFCRWTFSNLIRQGDITISGPMTLRRVSPLSEIVLE